MKTSEKILHVIKKMHKKNDRSLVPLMNVLRSTQRKVLQLEQIYMAARLARGAGYLLPGKSAWSKLMDHSLDLYERSAKNGKK